MKKLIAYLIICLLVPTWSFAASYYGCATASVNSDSTFCATPSGSCAGSDAVTAATALAGTNTLYANGCTLSITDSFTATAISTADGDGAGAAVAGGSFTYDTSTVTGKTLKTNVSAGSTSCLVVSGSGSGTVLTIDGNITGGTSSNASGVSDNHTVGTVSVTGNVTAGTGSSTTGYYAYGTSGAVTISGNVIASTHRASSAIYAGAAGTVTVAGNIIGTTSNLGFAGSVIWAPSAVSNYIKIQTTSGNFLYMSQAPDKSKVLTDTSVVIPTTGTYEAGTATTGGGGAWAN